MKDIQLPAIAKAITKKSRGGQEIEPLAKARNILWCKGVKDLTDTTNPKLDEMFVWRHADDLLKNAPAKIFERIEKVGMYPRGKGRGLKRNLPEIVEVVDQHPNFLGTAIIFNSKLWELFELKTISEKEILKRIDDVFSENGVERYPYPKIESWRYGRNPEVDVQHPVNPSELMRLQAANLPKITWVYLMLLFYFFIKTTISGRSERLLNMHTDSLKDYFEEGLGDFGQECFVDALKKIQSIEVVRIF